MIRKQGNDMESKNFKYLIILISLLAVSILLMGISLVLSEKTFGMVSSYIAIGCVVITLIGVAVIIRSNHKNKKKDDEDNS